jgi:hypothetical protein
MWGSGANPTWQTYLRDGKVPFNITVYGTRGPKTWDDYFQQQFPDQIMYSILDDHQRTTKSTKLVSTSSTNVTSTTNYGDPGFLIPYIYSQYQKINTSGTDGSTTIQKFCVVPHFQDLYLPPIQNVTEYSTDTKIVIVISPHNGWEYVISELQKCNYIMSSSLHGLIVADGLGIPSIWFQIPGEDTERIEGQFKYDDYYSSMYYGRSQVMPTRAPIPYVDQVVNVSAYWDPPTDELRYIYSQNLIESFPYHLFERSCD